MQPGRSPVSGTCQLYGKIISRPQCFPAPSGEAISWDVDALPGTTAGSPWGEGQRLGVLWPPSAPQSTGTCCTQLSSSTFQRYSSSFKPASQNVSSGNAKKPLPLPCVLRPPSPLLCSDVHWYLTWAAYQGCCRDAQGPSGPKSWTGTLWSHLKLSGQHYPGLSCEMVRDLSHPGPPYPLYPQQEGCLYDCAGPTWP